MSAPESTLDVAVPKVDLKKKVVEEKKEDEVKGLSDDACVEARNGGAEEPAKLTRATGDRNAASPSTPRRARSSARC